MPSTVHARSSSARRMRPSSSRDEKGMPDDRPGSPSVGQYSVTRVPASACFANVPPVAKVSSSGCANTAASARIECLSATPAAAAEQRDDGEEEVEQVE